MNVRMRFASCALVFAVWLPSAGAAESGEAAADRRIRAESSIGRTLLAAPYGIVAVTSWPVKKVVMWMESVNFPARIGDAVLFPVRLFPDGDEE